MFDLGDDDLVAGLAECIAPTAGDQVDRLGRAAREDHLFGPRRVEEALHFLPGCVDGVGALGTEVMRAAMDVRIGPLVAVDHRLDDLARMLSRRPVVQVSEPHAFVAAARIGIHPLMENREIGPQ